jgi:RNA polymerase sigma-70 factor (ECF subfamily)
MRPEPRFDAATAPDEELVSRVRGGEVPLFEALMRRHNQQVYRAARAICGDDAEAEDVAQQAWVAAFEHLAGFAGTARFSTWVTRIAVHEALARRRRAGRAHDLALVETEAEHATPEDEVGSSELGRVLASAIDELPEGQRAVFVLREVQELSTAETAQVLELTEEAVRVRLLRARRQLQASLYDRAGLVASDVFRFDGARCDRIVAAVMARVGVRSGG